MPPRNYRIKIEQEKFYHIWNRGNNKENLFYKWDNYEYFIRLYDEYMDAHVDTYAFCLLPNHFHLLIRTKRFHQVGETTKDIKSNPVSKAFQGFFTAYSQAINIQQRRTGSLFQKPFKRLEVNHPKHFASLVHYIHSNPQHHGIIDDFRQYPWSSYKRVLKNRPSKLQKETVLNWFKNEENYLNFHSNEVDMELIKHLMIE